MLPQKHVGIVIGSTRPACNGAPIAQWVDALIRDKLQPKHEGVAWRIVDLRSFNLPLLDEPGIPAAGKEPVHAHTKAWQQEVASIQAFIFVTPQYNWGYPAALKNALDYLYAEWSGKPAGIISYGGHGGGKAAAQLQEVLNGLKMNVMATKPAITLAKVHIHGTGVTAEQAATDFSGHAEDILTLAREIVAALEAPGAGAS